MVPPADARPSPGPDMEGGQATSSEPFVRIAYRRPLRHYQRLAVDAFERARANGRRQCYLVLPPGAGKTVLGLEIVRRLGQRALVLCPNTAVQAQWLGQWQEFQPPLVPATADAALPTSLSVLTYQALCNLNGDDATLDEDARALWRATLRHDKGLSDDQAGQEVEALAAAAPARFREELLRFRRHARDLVTRGGDREQLLALLHPNGRRLVETLRQAAPCTLVLDECHHLLEMWGHLVRAVIDELGERVFVVGLTATPPADMDTREAALYAGIFGRADLAIPTPAVVKEGDLAPYQEMAYLTQPMAHERRYIDDQHARFQALTLRLLEPDFASTPFVEWLQRRVVERRARAGAQVSWARFEQDEPALAQAALRFFFQHGLALPEGARLGERHRRAPGADDWAALIEDYCLGVLKVSADPRDAAAWQEIRRALPSLGYVLSAQGIRTYVSPVDRVLSLSASKAAATLDILAAERRVLDDQLRALVLCDYEVAGREVLAKLRGVLDPQAGSAALLLHILLSDPAVARLDPVLVTGRTVACSRSTAVSLGAWLEQQVPRLAGTVVAERLLAPTGDGANTSWDDLVVVRPSHAWWQPRHYVPLITRYFESGQSRCLVGTRALLGEGWDATKVNVLIDLTAAGTSTAVHQMRGRSLRLDPDLPRKVADNWDVICVAPDHPKGHGDYLRFVRKHRHYFAPTAEGEIESGVSHVDHSLSPFGPPPAPTFGSLNAGMLRRVEDRDGAYARWRVGQPYENQDAATLRVAFGRAPGLPTRRLLRRAPSPIGRASAGARAAAVAVVAGVCVALATVAGHPLAGLATAVLAGVAGFAWIALSLRAALGRLSPSDTLEDFAAAVADALCAAGAVDRSLGAPAVRVAAQSDGYYRCYIAGASAEESQRFAEALDEVLSPLAAPRYVIPRTLAQPPRSTAEALRLALRPTGARAAGRPVVYHAVPALLATNRDRVEAFRVAWNRHVSGGEPLHCQSPAGQAILAAQRGEDPFAISTQLRTLWR